MAAPPPPPPSPRRHPGPTGIAIVPIAEVHAESFHACLDAVAREQRYLAQTSAPPLERLRGFVQDGVRTGVAQFVAVDPAQRVLGWCDIFPAWAQAVQHTGRLGMGVLASHRGQGLGRQLLAACIAKARAQGISRVELEARADNRVAIGLYERMGFVHEAVKPRALRFDGVYFDAVQMRLLLDPLPGP